MLNKRHLYWLLCSPELPFLVSLISDKYTYGQKKKKKKKKNIDIVSFNQLGVTFRIPIHNVQNIKTIDSHLAKSFQKESAKISFVFLKYSVNSYVSSR